MPDSHRSPRRDRKTSDSSFIAQAHREYHEAMGAVMGLPVAAGIGYYLDTLWDSAPWCLIFGALLGAAASVVSLRELLQRMDEQSAKDRQKRTAELTSSRPPVDSVKDGSS